MVNLIFESRQGMFFAVKYKLNIWDYHEALNLQMIELIAKWYQAVGENCIKHCLWKSD